MELLSLLPIELVYATTEVKSSFFTALTNGANLIVNIIKWAALLWVLVKVSMLGFKVATQAKNSSDALKTVKDEGFALAIGLFIVVTTFWIHGAMKESANVIISQSGESSGGFGVGSETVEF